MQVKYARTALETVVSPRLFRHADVVVEISREREPEAVANAAKALLVGRAPWESAEGTRLLRRTRSLREPTRLFFEVA